MMTPEEIDQLDKQEAAAHEAGHATVAAVLGFSEATASILNRESADELSERTWGGKTEIYRAGRNANDRAAYCIARIVAECIASEESVGVDEIPDWWRSVTIEPSPTDYTAIPKSWTRARAIERALNILRDNRRLFDAIVAALPDGKA